MTRFLTRALGALAATVLMLSGAQAATPAEFYKGRTVTILIGYSPGGGYDLYARLLAQHLGRHIPGNPTVIAQNMPGAGSLKAANYIYSVAPKDGTAMATFARGMGTATLLGQAKFDPRLLTWIGSVTKDVSLCVSWHQSPVKSWNDVMKREFLVGGDGAESDPDIFAKLYKNVFGAKLKLATGFPGTSDITLAMQRREVEGLCGISWSTVKAHYATWLQEKKLNILLQAGLEKEADLPNVPLALDLAKTPEQKQILDFVIAAQVMARPFAAPPNIPADRKAALRKAFDDTMKDPVFLAGAAKLMLDVNPVNGAAIDTLIAELYATPKPVIAKAAYASTH